MYPFKDLINQKIFENYKLHRILIKLNLTINKIYNNNSQLIRFTTIIQKTIIKMKINLIKKIINRK